MTRSVETVLVVGCGSIGRRHLRNLKSLGVPTLLAVDSREDRRQQAANESGATAMPTLAEALDKKPACVLVATPSASHMIIALEAARHGCHLFVEKPLSHTMDHVDELIDLAARQRLVTMVACNYRFDPGLNMLKNLIDEGAVGTVISVRSEFGFYLPQSHPYEDYRETYPAQEVLGGGVILDRTHELDYLRWIFGDVADCACFYDKRSHLQINTEDVAEALLRFKSGVIASLHLDYIEREYRCMARIIGDQGTIEWAFFPHRLRLYSSQTKEWKILLDEPKPDLNEMYMAELQHFLDAVKKQSPTCHPLVEGKRLLELLLRLKQREIGGMA
jgi:predicted dehydrogenase